MVGGRRIEAGQVVIAMSSYQRPITPAFASQLDRSIVQLHSVEYRNPAQLPEGDVLVVGAGNSGAEIAIDLVRAGRRVWISGRQISEVPFDVRKAAVRRFIMPVLFRLVFHRLLTVDTPIGRRARPAFTTGGTTLIRTRSRDLKKASVERVPRVAGVENGQPRLADGRVLRVGGIVWSTGFDLGRSWIQLPVFDDHGEPVQSRGVAPDEPGLYFVGPHFLYSASSTMIHGIGRDAQRVAEKVAQRAGARVSR